MNNERMKLFSRIAIHFFLFTISCHTIDKEINNDDVVKPYSLNPKYWQYKNEPLLLLGASDDDNLFQMQGLEYHLDELSAAGGNYIRNTMSCRDSGNVFPFLRLENGKYDLDVWNDEFWDRFSLALKLTHEKDIIVQIEVWDRFDYSQQFWGNNPFNPANNVNYTLSDSIFEDHYPMHPGADLHPFFHTIPGMPRYKPSLDRIRVYQEKYIDRLIGYTLNYGHVLYCMNNETNTPVQWGNYWIDFIRRKAKEKGREVYLTDMYDDFYKINSCDRCKDLIAMPEYYTFMDISQINSRNFGQAHWDTLQAILDYRDKYALRPVNNTKIYGGGNFGFGSGTNSDGIERFCRNVIGGCASARHHRPPHGNGLNEKAKASLKATRKVEEWIKLWEVAPRMDLINNRDLNEAYLTAKEGEKYLFYFPKGGAVNLDLQRAEGAFILKWININNGEWGDETIIQGGEEVEIAPLNDDAWYAVIIKKQ